MQHPPRPLVITAAMFAFGEWVVVSGCVSKHPQAESTVSASATVPPSSNSASSSTTASARADGASSGGAGSAGAASGGAASAGIGSAAQTSDERTAGANGNDSGNGAVANEMPDGSDDDIVARRLRKAAEQETDPELKDKLWKEYVEYKKNTQGK